MGKELVISSTRHETKVAVLEDDQLVEVFFQRSNEYMLAGSIRKGRVTRVLPGMQSAFVDIGLERDAFLYVTDFFEENEEYDRIATTKEDTAVRAGRRAEPRHLEVRHAEPPAAVEPPAATEPLPAQAAERPVAERPAPERPVPERPVAERPAAQRAPSPPAERDSEPEGRGDRGRRSRRRRPRGGGFPESKYASLRTEAPPDATGGEFAVLPGESLAKYTQASSDAEMEGDAAEAAAAAPGQALEAEEEAETLMREAALATAPPVEDEHAEAEATPPPVEPEPEPVESAATAREATPEPPPEQPLAEEGPRTLGPARMAKEGGAPEAPAEASAEAESDLEIPGLAELPEGAIPDQPEAGEEPASGEAAAEPAPEAAPEAEEVEPARMPVSLTATLREQGYRYMRRVSRRARRKMRAGQPADAPAEERPAPLEEPAAEPKVNGRGAERLERPAQPSIAELLREGQEVLVQIAKEPLGQKGARITSHIALPGRYVVYMPTVDHMGVSRKVSSEDERLRLKRILQTHSTGMPGGFIVRTAGEGKPEAEIAADMKFLFSLWLDIRQKADARPAPALIHHDLDLVSRILRDQMTDVFKTVWADNEEVYETVLRFVERFQPSLVGRVKLYTRDMPIFDAFKVTEELEKALRPKVWLKSGGYIVINQTEALVAIDVNTGKFVGRSNRLEDTIVKINTEAVREIVRQLRLRDLGGIIVVDFIDMDERKNRQKVFQALDEAMRSDRAPNKILQFNDFGLVAITRKRVKQSLERTLCSPCPYCEGAGYVKSVQTLIGEILQEAHREGRALEGGDVTLRVNPEVAKAFKSQSNTYLEELEEVLGRSVIVVSDALLQQEKFDLV